MAARTGAAAHCEPVRVAVGACLAVDDEPVRAAAVFRDPGVLGERAAPVEPERDRTRRRLELHVLAAEAARHGVAVVDIEPLGRGDVRHAQQQHELVERAGGRGGVLLLGGRDLPDRPVGRLHDAAEAPQRLRGRLDHRRARGDRRVEVGPGVGRLRHGQRERESAEARRRGVGLLQPQLGAQPEGGGVEVLGGGEVGHLEGDGGDGSHAARLRPPGRCGFSVPARFTAGTRRARRRPPPAPPRPCGDRSRSSRPPVAR